MISSFFSKTKPVNYVILAVCLLLFYGFYVSYVLSFEIWTEKPVWESLAAIALVLELLIINEIIRTEKITEFSSFSMLFFVLLLLAFPDTILDKNGIFTNFFLILAVWRLLAIKSMKNVKHKIFDASFFICVSSLFYDWALLFLILVFLVINVYERNVLKNWLVPFISFFTVLILSFTVLQLSENLDFFKEHYTFGLEFLEDDILETRNIKLFVFTFLSIAVMALVFLRLRKRGSGKLLRLRILFFFFLVAVAVSVLKIKSSSPLILGFFPTAVFLTNYVESLKNSRLKEIVVSILILAPMVIFVVRLTS